MTKPLPCPFCGAEPWVDSGLSDAPFPPGEEWVSCPTVHLNPDHTCGAFQIGIDRWNTRADTALPREREQVKVKPLVWVADEDDPDCIRSGEYWIYHEGLGYQVYLGAVVFGDPHKTLAAAKDAVWQHHVAYILASLETDQTDAARDVPAERALVGK